MRDTSISAKIRQLTNNNSWQVKAIIVKGKIAFIRLSKEGIN